MGVKKYIEFEIKKASGWGYIAVVLIFLMASSYFLQFGISQYKHILEEKNNFQKFEREKYKYYIYPSKHCNYGIRLLYIPSPFMAFFDNGPVPVYMTTFIDGSERMKIYQHLKGQSAFSRVTCAFMTFAGFILLFGSGLVLFYGFSGSKDHEWLKFLEELAGKRKRLFLYQLISKMVLLFLFCLAMAALSIILFTINGVAISIGWVLIFTLGIFMMLFFFLFMGLIAGTLKSRSWGWASMGIAWFFLAFCIPVLIYHFTYSRASSIKSTYKMEIVKLDLFQKYESEGLEKGGKFDQSKRGSETEKGMFLYFWNGGFKRIMNLEKEMLDEMKERISFYQSISGLFPTTFFISVSNEMSSRGFSNLVAFNEYSSEMKKSYIWYLAQNYIFSDIMEFPPFIKGNENIYKGQIRLPGNFGFGLVVSILWLIVLFGLCWIRFNRMLERAQDTEKELNPDELKKDKTNVIFTSDKGILPHLIAKLKFQNIPFVSIPGPSSLPGDTKVKNLLYFFSIPVPETLKEISGEYIYTLELHDKLRAFAEIIRALKADVLIFNNFLSGLSDDLINYFADVLNDLKNERIVVYFTNSFLATDAICDNVIKWKREKISF
jgi:ABC-type transport system involved in multi-copper enzyme maturation permease subunit